MLEQFRIFRSSSPSSQDSCTDNLRLLRSQFTAPRFQERCSESMRIMMCCILLLGFALIPNASGLVFKTGPNADHLVVLTHGIMGTGEDLGYLATLLEQNGCSVLKSISNENLKSLNGFKTGGEKLASEITKCIAENNQLKRLSVVGNSLGGLYVRYAMKILFNDSDSTIAGLQPHRFMSIATPHLGVKNWTFVEDYGYTAPDIIKRIVSRTMLSTGKDIFGFKDGNEDTLLFKMATEETFLNPLRSFSERRLYANLNRDFVVPLGTAAFMHNDLVKELRKEHNGKTGIVTMLTTPASKRLNGVCANDEKADLYDGNDGHTNAMIQRLNGLGWEKVIVNFPGLLPIAHNKICALSREPKWLFENILGFNAGQFVMKDASAWLSE